MRLRVFTIVAVALLLLVPTVSSADLGTYSQDFEGLDQTSPTALTDDGWLVFGNVFNATGGFLYPYGPFGAPNGGPGFSGIDIGQGGPEQGAQQLVVYNDYNNGDHGACFNAPPFDETSPSCRFIEANVFQEQTVGAADVGTTWLFEYDSKRGNIEAPPTTALAFIKTLDPNAGFALTNFLTIDMTNVPNTWGRYQIEIFIDSSLQGQILQFGYLSKTTAFKGSGIFYDNISFDKKPIEVAVDVKPEGCPSPLNVTSRGDLPVAIMGTVDLDVTTIDPASIRLEGVAPLKSDFEDVGAPFEPFTGKMDCMSDCNDWGPDGMTDLTLKFDTGEIVEALGAVQNRECVVVSLTGNLLVSQGGDPIVGEDVVVVLDPFSGSSGPSGGTALYGIIVQETPSGTTTQSISPR